MKGTTEPSEARVWTRNAVTGEFEERPRQTLRVAGTDAQ